MHVILRAVMGACAVTPMLQTAYAAEGGAFNTSTRPIRLITPAPPGGSTDFLARLIAPRLAQALKRQVVVDNRGGGGGVVAAELTARAAPDGNTLLMAYSQHTTNVSLNPKLNYRAVDDFQPIVHVTNAALVLVVNPNVPVQNVQELVNYGKANPGKLNFSSAGNGSGGHMAVELLKYLTKTNAQHIPYKGMGPSVVDLVGGNVQATFAGMVPIQPTLRSGRVRAIATTGVRRAASLPDVPTVIESGVPGFDVVTWYGILAPAGLPKPAVTMLNRELVNILRSADVEQRLSGDGAEVIAGTPESFEKTLRAEMDKWAKVVKATGARLD